MIIIRRRLLYWLIKEYLKRWGKTIVFFFLIGLAAFFFFRLTSSYLLAKIPIGQQEVIGVVGAYQLDNLPQSILSDVSSGLTKLQPNGEVAANIAKSWKIDNNDKRYTFYLRQDVFFADGTALTAQNVSYNFTDAKVKKVDKYTLVFELKDKYSPFLVSLSRPMFKKGLVGVGSYRIRDVKLNGNFVESLTLVNAKDPYKKKVYKFYPDTKALKIAFLLGETTAIRGITDPVFNNVNFSDFPNATVTKRVNYNQLVTLFFNTKDRILSDRNVRIGLSFAMPNEFSQGERTSLPYQLSSWTHANQYAYTQDVEQAKILTKELQKATDSASLTIVIKTLPRYKETAEKIASSWNAIGLKGKVEVVESIPSNFKAFLGDFSVPKDPDQYRLWHSGQDTNISRYENKRIDKLLEDGRTITDATTRKKLYSDFQKYLLADAPAAFLYFPYEYEVKRK